MKVISTTIKQVWIPLILIVVGVALTMIENNAIHFLSGMMVGLCVVSLFVTIYGLFNATFKSNFEQHMKDERAIHIYGVGAQISWLLTICLLAILAICLPQTTLLLWIIMFMSLSFAFIVYLLRKIS